MKNRSYRDRRGRAAFTKDLRDGRGKMNALDVDFAFQIESGPTTPEILADARATLALAASRRTKFQTPDGHQLALFSEAQEEITKTLQEFISRRGGPEQG